MTVGELKGLLEMLPEDATVHATEGEDRGIIIRRPDDHKQLAFLETRPL